MPESIPRLLAVPDRSFFLFGPRGVGKSTWLRDHFTESTHLDLLDTSLQLELSREPSRLEAVVGDRPEGSWVVLDEIQKVPRLLDEVHRLMETRGWRFALCGSSARKIRRGGVDLLAGRAITRRMEAFCSCELGSAFVLERAISWGTLPLVHLDQPHAADILDSYMNTYLREEIREEGIVRNLSPFLRFLAVAGTLSGQVLNRANIARDASVPRSTVDVYFSILQDSLVAHFLPAYRPSAKVREQAHPKLYWFDTGVARAAAGLLFDPLDRLWKGLALEALLFHELRVYNDTQRRHRQIAYYRAGSGPEIDFVIETRRRTSSAPPQIVCVEVKLAERWDRRWERPMRSLRDRADSVSVRRMFGVYTGSHVYHFDGVDVLPVQQFLRLLYGGGVF